MATPSRRQFLAVAATGSAAWAFPPMRAVIEAIRAPARSHVDFGALQPPDEFGVQVPAGFRVQLVGRTGDVVPGTRHLWHAAPDGGAAFADVGGGHTIVSNSEVSNGGGGVSAVSFDSDGQILSARSILSGTSRNCAGGATPWHTWLSCEEHDTGLVWECDPYGQPAVVRPALGRFRHEAVAIDPVARHLYLTEDQPDGRLYRFVPDQWADLSSGELQAAVVDGGADGGRVSWVPVPADAPARDVATAAFDGGEGIVVEGRTLYLATKGDRRVWSLDLETSVLRVFHDCVARPDTALTHVDNLAVHPKSGHLFVAEDGGNVELCLLTGPSTPSGDTNAIAVVRFAGHSGSEVAGPAFSPDGWHLYVSSQRGSDGRGITVQVSGPWGPWASKFDRGASVSRSAVRLDP